MMFFTDPYFRLGCLAIGMIVLLILCLKVRDQRRMQKMKQLDWEWKSAERLKVIKHLKDLAAHKNVGTWESQHQQQPQPQPQPACPHCSKPIHSGEYCPRCGYRFI